MPNGAKSFQFRRLNSLGASNPQRSNDMQWVVSYA